MTPRNLIEPARLAGEAVLRSQSDGRLIDLVRAGNDRAFEAIVHRYRRALLRYCARFLSGPRAEDAVQQTFINAYKAMKADERDIDLKPWLYRIAHNASLNALRATSGAVEEPISEQIDGVERPDQAVERRQDLADVVAAVQALPPRQRDAIVLHELEGRSYEQIASEMNVSGGAVRQLLSRARTTLRAGATAIVPEWAIARMATAGGDPVAPRVAELVAAGGGAALVAKVGTAVVVAGAVAVGAAEGPLDRSDHRTGNGQREAAVLTPASSAVPGARPAASAPAGDDTAGARAAVTSDRRGKRGRRHRGGDDGSRSGSSGSGGDDSADDHSGSGSSASSGSGSSGGDDDSHPGPGDHSGSGSGEDRSGSGEADDDNSGPGSLATDEPDNSGSGSSGSGSSGDDSGSNSGSGSGDSIVTIPAPDDDSSGSGSSGSGDSSGEH
jgi:RNA polymerase sigma factor (sigma-70 family)